MYRVAKTILHLRHPGQSISTARIRNFASTKTLSKNESEKAEGLGLDVGEKQPVSKSQSSLKTSTSTTGSQERPSPKTIQELDDALKAKMEDREGSAGILYENGKPITDSYGRGVRSNIFRVI